MIAIAVVTAGVAPVGAAPDSGGTLFFRMQSGPDWIDPGQTWYTYGYVVAYATNRALYATSPDHPGTPVPDLAATDPSISPDGMTVTVTMRAGVKFAPPVNREVTSADVKYAIERAFSENVSNGYIFSYFGDLVGSPDEPGPISDISGIETPDATTLVFHLRRSTAAPFVAALSLPVTMPVPEEYAAPFDAENPSTYDSHVAFTGPYMIKNDAEGNLIGLGDSIEIVRNPNWEAATDFRPAHLDAVTITFGPDPTKLAKQTLKGSHAVCCDAVLSREVLKLRSAYPHQFARESGHGTRWVALNTSVKPLHNRAVRKAIAAVMNRKVLRRSRGGPVAGRIAKHFLPPGLPGFDESGGYQGFASAEYYADPTGDRALARKFMLRARHDGLPVNRDGQYTGRNVIGIVGTKGEPGESVARSVKRQVERLGFPVHLRLVRTDRMYNEFCGVRSAKVAICPNVGWFFDFFDPQSLLEPTFSGHAIAPSGSSNNYSMLDNARINAAIDDAATLPPGPARWQAWGAINKLIVKQVPGVPWLWDDSYAVRSADVRGVMNPFFSSWDLSFTSLRS